MNKLEFLNRAVEIVKMAMAKGLDYRFSIDNINQCSDCSCVSVYFGKNEKVTYCEWGTCKETLDEIEKALNEYEAL